MKITLSRSYKKLNKKGVLITMFVYMVSGSEQQLADYKAAAGDHYREDDDGNPIWFSSNYVGKTGKLLITTKGKIVPDTSEFDQAASMAAQYGGNLGQALANAFASQIVGRPVGNTVAPVSTDPVPDDKLD